MVLSINLGRLFPFFAGFLCFCSIFGVNYGKIWLECCSYDSFVEVYSLISYEGVEIEL